MIDMTQHARRSMLAFSEMESAMRRLGVAASTANWRLRLTLRRIEVTSRYTSARRRFGAAALERRNHAKTTTLSPDGMLAPPHPSR